jgi:hypothetical protein
MDINIKLPDFLIIGAQKSGTTSLYHYCRQHPEIFMPAIKEPMFFNSKFPPNITLAEDSLKNPYRFFTLAEYVTLFEEARPNQKIGDASTAYLANPETSLWMKKIIPDVKIIAIIRNPLHRAFSAYQMYSQRGIENRSFEDAIAAGLRNEEATVNQGRRYLTLGLYAAQLTPFTQIFPKEQIFIGDYDEYNSNNIDFLRRIFRFLQVKDFVPGDLKRLQVTDTTPKSSEFSAPLVKKMKAFFKKDIEVLQTMVEFDVKKWLL